jgi:hypothetical protein
VRTKVASGSRQQRRGGTICIPAEAVAQAWRGPRQARLARLLKSPGIDIAVMTLSVARSIGLMCAETAHDDVADVHVVLCARQRQHAIVTSDPSGITRIDPTVPQILV